MIKNLILSLCLMISVNVFAQGSAEKIWIDVRTINEYQQEHLDGAINIPHTQIIQRISEVTDNKQASIHLYCLSGVRSKIAQQALQGLGYENVINEGGLKDVKAAQ